MSAEEARPSAWSTRWWRTGPRPGRRRDQGLTGTQAAGRNSGRRLQPRFRPVTPRPGRAWRSATLRELRHDHIRCSARAWSGAIPCPRAGGGLIAGRSRVQARGLECIMVGKPSDSKNTLYCSFCGKSQHEVRKLIAGPTVFICDECVELVHGHHPRGAQDAPREVARRRADAQGDLQGPRRLRDRPEPREEGALGRGAQPLQAAGARREEQRRRDRQVQHPAGRAHRVTGKTLLAQTWPASWTCRSPWPTRPR